MTRAEWKLNNRETRIGERRKNRQQFRLEAWKRWNQGKLLLNQIRAEIADKLQVFQKDYDYELKLLARD